MMLRMLCHGKAGSAPYFVEVQGTPLDLPNMPAGAFAIHSNPFAGSVHPLEPLFCVTHVETGARMTAADSNTYAVWLACRKAEKITPAMYAEGLTAMRAIAATATETRVPDPELYPEHSGNPDHSEVRGGQTFH
ncbi:hypothetical protein [Paraburkholderia humisilvae]|uniref:Uncharacterized protein n=1 Tax=Paraburkholderia humisilvae TaxID=627669 RepID=A0A6J5ED65_9BURK|nr:hypothetical protein [Paraburkholderia humisilvae]CAB3764203.1 hypothetical protein LMG29542_04813 [Paraburkholderia humisilvae]